jgi:ribosomal protein S18 acetylase RimI-like enzyme
VDRLELRSAADGSAAALNELCGLSPVADRLGRWLAASVAAGSTRPVWWRTAWSATEGLLAAHSFWAPRLSEVPQGVDLLGHRDRSAASALLSHDLDWLGVDVMDCQVVTAHDADESLRRLRTAEARVLADAGFELLVDRVRVEWLPTSVSPPAHGSLAFRPASRYPGRELLEVFAAVGDGSLDAHMRADRSALGRIGEAGKRLARCAAMDHQDEWFAVAVQPDGTPVGYVLVALVDGDRPVLAEIGVVAAMRGRGLVNDLLAFGTRVLAEYGAPQIRGDVDAANHPMRAAFSRAGYREFAVRQDYRWTRPASAT